MTPEYHHGNTGQHPQQYLQDYQKLLPDGPEEQPDSAENGADRILQALQAVQQPLVHAQGQAGGNQPGQNLQPPDSPESGAVQKSLNLIQQQLVCKVAVPGGGDDDGLQPADHVVAADGGKPLHQQRGQVDNQRHQQCGLPVPFQRVQGFFAIV